MFFLPVFKVWKLDDLCACGRRPVNDKTLDKARIDPGNNHFFCRLKEHDEKVEKYGEKKAGQMERNERMNQALGSWHVPGFGAHKQDEQPPPKDEGKQGGGGWFSHLPGSMHKPEPKKDKENKGWFDFGGGGGASPPSDAKIKLMKVSNQIRSDPPGVATRGRCQNRSREWIQGNCVGADCLWFGSFKHSLLPSLSSHPSTEA